jgi:hypothetical protein
MIHYADAADIAPPLPLDISLMPLAIAIDATLMRLRHYAMMMIICKHVTIIDMFFFIFASSFDATPIISLHFMFSASISRRASSMPFRYHIFAD